MLNAKVGNRDELDMTCLAARTAPGQARTLVELRLASWGLARLRDDATLIASELVTNAVIHTPDDGEIRLRLTRQPMGVLLAVWDSSDARPVRKRSMWAVAGGAAADAEALALDHDDGTGGRGLLIVEELADACGVTETEPRGKWVWARIGGAARRGRRR
ncbi:ATP-binding protein [Actinomadura viridis]|uniref:Anti-sigma regulatory factor (Ser/Thr protein kinase) n=1 Tax=Actinomadura viridis TaxID=58110 RepID=A0A931DQE9_9ACTN|nr:ATP-binding protein [Actinomadura viridis]MBG6093937.1 anti-sigma regulatory factor (Ser/Thr protein kinase) [Actinomadura viridis]